MITAKPLRQQNCKSTSLAGTEHSIGIQLVNKGNKQDKKPLVLVSFVVTSTHLLSHPCLAVGKLCLKCKQKGHFAHPESGSTYVF